MRAFGLVGVLITMAIVVYMLFAYTGGGGNSYMGTVAEGKKKAEEQVNTIAGRTDDGRKATDTVRYSLVMGGSKITGVRLDSVEPGGAMQKKYGLMAGDVIVEFPNGATRDVVSSQDDATVWLHEAYARSMPLVVMRGASRITLPDQRDVKPTAPALAPAISNVKPPVPANPAPTAPAPTAPAPVVTTPAPATAPTAEAPAAEKPKPARNIYNQANNLRDQIEGNK